MQLKSDIDGLSKEIYEGIFALIRSTVERHKEKLEISSSILAIGDDWFHIFYYCNIYKNPEISIGMKNQMCLKDILETYKEYFSGNEIVLFPFSENRVEELKGLGKIIKQDKDICCIEYCGKKINILSLR